MTADVLLTRLAELGITAFLDRDGLRFRPAERLPPELRQAVVACRRELAALLKSGPDAAPQPGDLPADDELDRARQLAENWLATRAELEQLVLAAAARKCWPCLELGQGAYLPPGRQTWERHVHYPCVTPEHLVNLLESLSRK